MEKYMKAQMEVIEFENEDVITDSGICPAKSICGSKYDYISFCNTDDCDDNIA